MADPKDKASAPPETKPAGKSAAVKPPVLEGKARPAASAPASPPEKPDPVTAVDSKVGPIKPEATGPESAKSAPTDKKPDAANAGPTKPEPAKTAYKSATTPPPSNDDGRGAGTAWLAGLVGGLVGLGAAYGLAALGYWPAAPVPQPQQDPRIAQVSLAVPELQTVTSTLQDELSKLTARVAEVESAASAPAETAEASGTEQISTDLAALSERVNALASAPQATAPEAAANAAAIESLEADLAALRQGAAQTRAELDTVSGKLSSLETEVSAGSAVEAGQARLPLIVSGFDSAFATGSAYDAEVAALRQALPNFEIPQSILANAMTGLKRADLVKRDFDAVLPDILAGRPAPADASWQDSAGEWFRGVLALRPTEAVDGTGPEASVARLEGAINRGDFVAAKAEFDALPDAMRAAAGAVGTDIANQAAAQSFITSLRQAALAGGNGA